MKLSGLRLITEDSDDEEKDKDIDIPELQISQNLKQSEVSELDLKKITYM
jgi:hypothetical protein